MNVVERAAGLMPAVRAPRRASSPPLANRNNRRTKSNRRWRLSKTCQAASGGCRSGHFSPPESGPAGEGLTQRNRSLGDLEDQHKGLALERVEPVPGEEAEDKLARPLGGHLVPERDAPVEALQDQGDRTLNGPGAGVEQRHGLEEEVPTRQPPQA